MTGLSPSDGNGNGGRFKQELDEYFRWSLLQGQQQQQQQLYQQHQQQQQQQQQRQQQQQQTQLQYSIKEEASSTDKGIKEKQLVYHSHSNTSNSLSDKQTSPGSTSSSIKSTSSNNSSSNTSSVSSSSSVNIHPAVTYPYGFGPSSFPLFFPLQNHPYYSHSYGHSHSSPNLSLSAVSHTHQPVAEANIDYEGDLIPPLLLGQGSSTTTTSSALSTSVPTPCSTNYVWDLHHQEEIHTADSAANLHSGRHQRSRRQSYQYPLADNNNDNNNSNNPNWLEQAALYAQQLHYHQQLQLQSPPSVGRVAGMSMPMPSVSSNPVDSLLSAIEFDSDVDCPSTSTRAPSICISPDDSKPVRHGRHAGRNKSNKKTKKRQRKPVKRKLSYSSSSSSSSHKSKSSSCRSCDSSDSDGDAERRRIRKVRSRRRQSVSGDDSDEACSGCSADGADHEVDHSRRTTPSNTGTANENESGSISCSPSTSVKSLRSSPSGNRGSKAARNHNTHRSKLPASVVCTLRDFFLTHINHPFPSEAEKEELVENTQLTRKQVCDWFTNNRKRYWRTYEKKMQQLYCGLVRPKKEQQEEEEDEGENEDDDDHTTRRKKHKLNPSSRKNNNNDKNKKNKNKKKQQKKGDDSESSGVDVSVKPESDSEHEEEEEEEEEEQRCHCGARDAAIHDWKQMWD